jgi:hypothetical protein
MSRASAEERNYVLNTQTLATVFALLASTIVSIVYPLAKPFEAVKIGTAAHALRHGRRFSRRSPSQNQGLRPVRPDRERTCSDRRP